MRDNESVRPWAEAFVVRCLSERGSNFRNEGTLDAYLKEHNITGLQGIDTRALTKILRNQGTMNGMITCAEHFHVEEVLERLRAYRVSGTVERVTTKTPVHYPAEHPKYKIALLDLGEKRNMTRCLNARGCDVTLLPAHTPAEEILSGGYDGVMLSNGPGDPADNVEIIAQVRKALRVRPAHLCRLPGPPVDGAGHQGLHRPAGLRPPGANHPVRDIQGRPGVHHQPEPWLCGQERVGGPGCG